MDWQGLSSKTMNWHACPGSLSAISLNRNQPAVELHSYKFHLFECVGLSLASFNEEFVLKGADITWYPDCLLGVYRYVDLEMTLEARYVDPEVVLIHYRVRNNSERCYQVKLYGKSKQGSVSSPQAGSCLVEQPVTIKDYRKKPLGEPFAYPHHLMWLVVMEKRTIEVGEAGEWTSAPIYVAPGEVKEGTVFLGTRWLGPFEADPADVWSLERKVGYYRKRLEEELVQERRSYWEELLEKVPPVKERYRDNENYLRLYRQAWVCIWQNITGSIVTARKTIKGPSASVGKVALAFNGPAQWETSLVGLLVSFIDPDVGIKIVQSVLDSIEDDDFIPEDLIFNRDVHLPTTEAFILEDIYHRTGKTDFLDRNYEKLYRQLKYHIRHPNFYYLSGDQVIRNMLFNYYSLNSLERIAILIGKDPQEIAEIRRLRTEVVRAIESMWEEKWQNSGAFVALFGYATEERAKGIVERIREYHLTPDRFYFLYQEPKGMKGDQEDLTYLKMSLYLYLVLGLECLEETELLDRIIQKTYDGITKCGDFWEYYRVTAEPFGNGPMGVFGAFGWIWALMEKESPYH